MGGERFAVSLSGPAGIIPVSTPDSTRYVRFTANSRVQNNSHYLLVPFDTLCV